MSVFNFIETFFFISLGITFVLISLLVYHFRQRIVLLEQKNDTMFEIINNIVSEITNIRNNFSFAHPFANIVQQTPSFQDNHFDDSDSHEGKKMVEDEDEEEEDEDDEEDEEEEDEDEDDESEKIIESDDEDSDLGKSIKIVNVNIESNTIDLTEINDLEIDELGESDDEININATAVDSEPIFVNKVDEFVTTVDDKKESIVDSKEIYKNMNTQNLKALVITKGLSSNPSKLKKNELVQLLENSE